MDGLQGNIPLTWTILGVPPFMETPTSDTVETIGFFWGVAKKSESPMRLLQVLKLLPERSFSSSMSFHGLQGVMRSLGDSMWSNPKP